MGMFSNPEFYHGLTRKYVIIFGTMFNEIFIDRVDTAGLRVQRIIVPIAYGPKQKYLARISRDPDLDSKTAGITLPRMSFQINNIEYAPERKLTTTHRQSYGTDNKTKGYNWMPVPYNYDFELSIMAKNVEDGTRILEQILPFFTPDWTISVNLVPGQPEPTNIPIILNGVTLEDAYEGDFETRRVMIWTLNFQLRGYLWGPTKSSGLIKQIDANMFTALDATRSVETVRVTPHLLDANGDVVNDALIGPNDAYGFDFTIIDNTS